MKSNYCEVVAIIDRSGSMSSVLEDAIGGFNTFLEKQKEDDVKTDLTLILFDDKYDIIHDCKDIDGIEPLNRETYVPRGLTALLDAIGRTINVVGERLSNMKESERPEKVIVTILTDGLENASKEFTNGQIHKMITHQREKYGWEFIFLAANQDAIATGTSLGIKKGLSMNYASTGEGTRAAYATMSSSVSLLKKAPASISKGDS